MPRTFEQSPAEDLLVEEGILSRSSLQQRVVIGCIGCRWVSREHVGGEPRFSSAEISQCSGAASDTLYPILRRLEDGGVIVGQLEDGYLTESGRPQRIYYRPGDSELSDEFLARLRIPPDCGLEQDS
jgi:hypothetical protein